MDIIILICAILFAVFGGVMLVLFALRQSKSEKLIGEHYHQLQHKMAEIQITQIPCRLVVEFDRATSNKFIVGIHGNILCCWHNHLLMIGS